MTKIGLTSQPVLSRSNPVLVEATTVVHRLQSALSGTLMVSQEAGRLVAEFLRPLAVLAFIMGLWRLSSDLGWTGGFVISRGLFSHFQVWFLLTIIVRSTASLMLRMPQPSSVGERD